MKLQTHKDYTTILLEPNDVIQIKFDSRGHNAPHDTKGDDGLTLNTLTKSNGEIVGTVYFHNVDHLFIDMKTFNLVMAKHYEGLKEIKSENLHLRPFSLRDILNEKN